MPSYPRISQVLTTFVEDQGYLVVNGIKVRPVVTVSGTDTTVSWQFEVNGIWKEATSRVNPI